MGAAADDGGFTKVGEATDLRMRAERLDEGLAIMDGLWKGKPYTFAGAHFCIDNMTMLPRPVQRPRIPIWVVEVWDKPKSMRRALSWDGIIPQKFRDWHPFSPEETRKLAGYVAANRSDKDPFDVICSGSTAGKKSKRAPEIVRPFVEAGATWWVEFDPTLERIRQGPPL